MKFPLLIFNFKNYREGSGRRAIKLARICERASRSNVKIVVCPQFQDIVAIRRVCRKTLVFSQHIDPIPSAGAFTGHVVAENLAKYIDGTLINHSEKKLSLDKIESCVNIAKALELKSICCASNLKEVIEIAKLSPDYIAFEDPELIGTGKSISTHKPELVERFVEIVRDINKEIVPLCGAGISNKEDVEAAKKLGVKGVLVASAIVKAENQREALLNLIL